MPPELVLFSQENCVTICSALIPGNLLMTFAVVLLWIWPRWSLPWLSPVAMGLAALMLLHVYTWFSVGMVMPETFILLVMGSTCLAINGWIWQNRRFVT
jgi:hypothetical protein